ncbi:MAG: hypothetical protein KGM98_01075 [Bacteroidota bacterium]|nr:hypothetical protein [Bacteroidota bacterium]
MKYLFLSAILFFSSALCYAQSELPAELHFNKLTVQNGLPEGYVNSMVQDKEGYIWMSTQRGLVRYDGYHAKVYTMGIKNPYGMSISTVYLDRKGRLWVGLLHSNTIYLYNRSRDNFVPHSMDSSVPGSSDNLSISKIHDDNEDRLWLQPFVIFFGKTFAICLFDPQTGKYEWYGKQKSGKYHINASAIFDQIQDGSGHIWLSSSNGMYEFNEKDHSFTGYLANADSAKQKGFINITEDSTRPDWLWLTNSYFISFNGTIGSFTQKGLWRFNTRTDSAVVYYHNPHNPFSIGSDTIFKVINDRNHRLWIGTERGLSLYDPIKNDFTNYYPRENPIGDNDAIIDLLEDKAGNFWCQTGFGLLYFNTHTRTFTRITANPKQTDGLISNYRNHTFMLDKNGVLWFGVQQIGVQWINRRSSGFIQYGNDPGSLHYFPGGTVSRNGFAKAADGTVWIGAEHGLYHWHPEMDSLSVIKFWKGKAVQPRARSVMVDKTGKVWFYGENSQDSGLDCFDPRTGNTIYYRYNKMDSTSLSSNKVTDIYQDHLGNIWVGTDGSGICKLDPKTGKFTRYPYIQNNDFIRENHGALDDGQVRSIIEDKSGTLWVGTNLGSLNRFNPTMGTFTSFLGIAPGFECISSIKEGPNNNLWIGTYMGGVFKFDTRTTKTEPFTENSGLLYDGAFAILEDSTQNLWFPSLRGISILNPKTGKVRTLTSADGLPGSNYFSGFKVTNSQFLFACDNGFIWVNPEDFTPDAHAPVVHIQSVAFTIPGSQSMQDSTIVAYGKKEIRLAYNQNRLTFSYVGLYYQNANLVQYAYKLDGYDKGWVSTGTLRAAVYTNLSPGTYTFHVKAANPDGVWSTEIPSLVITIKPPWWQTWWAYTIYLLLAGLTVYGFTRWRIHTLKKEKEVLEDKVMARTRELKESLDNLKTTQSQLIQSEKMASLGELTAGIAHEIQNPLNFVNNFSEVNKEMLLEMKVEMNRGNIEDANEIADDVIANSEKINHHGKRADAIVKSMLEHSRSSTGVKEPTDINKLADEYLRLAYHGLRAKDKSFNASFETHFDESIGKINIMSQDIGRVLLNLINNAFYATNEKAKQNILGYEPKVMVSTRKIDGKIEIGVKDNGNGIAEMIKNKIFQPFFTTKPTGSGTGLGLSLSYDIIKAHGGELKVDSKELEGSEFIILLPVN